MTTDSVLRGIRCISVWGSINLMFGYLNIVSFKKRKVTIIIFTYIVIYATVCSKCIVFHSK